MGAIVVTVHGTNVGAEADAGARWWQTDSEFCRRFSSLGTERGLELDIRPFHWDGANSDVARRRAGRALAVMLLRLLRGASEVSVVGHSHGGNVIAYALDDPWLWREYRCGALRVVSVGTPFFDGRRRWVSRINDIAMRTILSAVMLTFLGFSLWLAGAFDRWWTEGVHSRDRLDALIEVGRQVIREASEGGLPGLEDAASVAGSAVALLSWTFSNPLQFAALVVAAMVVVLGAMIFRQGTRLTVHSADMFRRRPARPVWRVIAHPADEAIALLAATPRTRLSPMTSSGAARSVRRLTPLIALATAVLVTGMIWTMGPSRFRSLPELAAPIEAAFIEAVWDSEWRYLPYEGAGDLPHTWVWDEVEHQGAFVVPEEARARLAGGDAALRAELDERISSASETAHDVTLRSREAVYATLDIFSRYMLAVLAFLTILALLAVWLVQLMFVALSPLVGRGMSFFANRSVTGAMTGAALGEDGEYVLRSVSSAPPRRFRARVVALSDDAVEQMYVDADRNAGESLRRMRRTIHNAPERTTGDSFGDLLAHISWRELIHTSYFECDEVAEKVLEGIAPNVALVEFRAAA